MSFTKKEALKFHRDMWSKIKEKYGNYATNLQRAQVKMEYIKEKHHDCLNNCYLCEYAGEARTRWIDNDCDFCPIDWSELADEKDSVYGTCLALYKNYPHDAIYRCAPIDEILALPERRKKRGMK